MIYDSNNNFLYNKYQDQIKLDVEPNFVFRDHLGNELNSTRFSLKGNNFVIQDTNEFITPFAKSFTPKT